MSTTPRVRMTIDEALKRTDSKSPSEALKKLKVLSGKRMGYLPHIGKKQREKGLKRLKGNS